jgi:RsiW-degrading membrane proteinase PrsW (M82 family)
VALLSHGVVAAFAFAFFLGFADAARALMEALRVDPRIGEFLTSPWAILLLVELAVVAPLTEEAGKAFGGLVGASPRYRAEAFVVGAAAGAGFAAIENILYAALAVAFGGPWQYVAIARTVGAPVHVVASGLVTLGIWDGRHEGGAGALLRGYGAGVGVHALWNGSLAILVIAATTASTGAARPAEIVELVFTASLGVLLGALLWRCSGQVRRGQVGTIAISSRPTVAAWVVLAASLLVPATVLIAVFPLFVG